MGTIFNYKGFVLSDNLHSVIRVICNWYKKQDAPRGAKHLGVGTRGLRVKRGYCVSRFAARKKIFLDPIYVGKKVKFGSVR